MSEVDKELVKIKQEYNKKIADCFRENGFPYTAQYIEMFQGNMNPWFWGAPNKGTEDFYKRCVEEGHEWDWYVDPPDYDNVVL